MSKNRKGITLIIIILFILILAGIGGYNYYAWNKSQEQIDDDYMSSIENLLKKRNEGYELANYLTNYSITPNFIYWDSNDNLQKCLIYKDSIEIGNFESINGMEYYPIKSTENNLYIASYQYGMGGAMKGFFMKYNYPNKKISSLKNNIHNYYVDEKQNYLFLVVGEDWENYQFLIYDFSSDQFIDQGINLKCNKGSNITGSMCGNLLFNDNKNNIIFFPLDYEDFSNGKAFILSKDKNIKAKEIKIDYNNLEKYIQFFQIKRQDLKKI